MAWLILAVALVVLLAVWVTWTANRIDRLDARAAAARSSLDAQLVRRAAGARVIAEADAATLGSDAQRLRRAAQEALTADDAGREAAENDLGRILSQLEVTDPARLAELREASSRVAIARSFYNDAVRDVHGLRGQRLPRLFHLGARRPLPSFFEIDDRL